MTTKPLIVAIVQIAMPERSREAAVASALRTAPTYRELADKGLLAKHYLNGPAGGGGVYLWRSLEEAQAWYDEQWKVRMKALFGAEPQVTFYESAVTVDNESGATIVREGA